MQIAQRENRKPFSFTTPGILLMNVRSWDNFVLITLKVGLLRTAGIIPYQIKINSQQENNAIINNVVDEILLNQTKKVSSAREAQEFLDSDYDDDYLYQIENMSLKETKEKLE